MRRRMFIALFALAVVGVTSAAAQTPAPTRYDGHKVVRVELRSDADVAAMEAISDDPWSESVGVGVVDYRVAPERMDDLRALGLRFSVFIDDVQRLIDAERATTDQRGGLAWFDAYRTNAEVSAYCDELVLLRPDVVSRTPVGLSIQSRDIYALRITGPGDDATRRSVLFLGGQHAREWVSISTMMFIADSLVRGYGVDQRITDILDELVIYIVPVCNPDGYEYTWTNQRLWRKNRRQVTSSSFGVDLNRNWGFQWGGAGSSGTPSNATYRGTAPFSEPETAALRDFVLARPSMAANIDFHSYSQLVLSPWGYTPDLATIDAADLDGLADDLADEIFAVHGKAYTTGPAAATLYTASGIATDWHYGDQNMYSWTIELRDTGEFGFVLPADQIVPTGQEALAASLALAERVRDSDRIRYEGPFNVPPSVQPGVTQPVTINARAIWGATLDASSMQLLARVGDDDYTEQPIWESSPGVFMGILPSGSCGSTISYYFTASTTFGDAAQRPSGAPADVFTLTVLLPDAECPTLPGDVNGDGVVDFVDFSIVLAQYGQSGPDLEGDVDGDGVVDFADFSIVLANYGSSL